MKINLALELPTVALEELNPLADMDFAIAYRVLADPAYARHYRRRSPHRTLVLDNGFHELGKPASWRELIDAAMLTNPDYIIVPDNRGPHDAADNLRELDRALAMTGHPEQLAVVVAGTNEEERRTFVQACIASGVGMLCFSRMVNRRQWFDELRMAFPPTGRTRVHLLGVSSLEELCSWREVSKDVDLSVDTSKPAKAALLGRTLPPNGSLRGMPVVSKTLFEQPMDERTIELCRHNIRILKEACGR